MAFGKGGFSDGRSHKDMSPGIAGSGREPCTLSTLAASIYSSISTVWGL